MFVIRLSTIQSLNSRCCEYEDRQLSVGEIGKSRRASFGPEEINVNSLTQQQL